MTPHTLLLTFALSRLQQARERVAHGCPSLALALAGPPYAGALARLQEAEAVRYKGRAAPAAEALSEALALVDEARELWGTAPDALPPMSSDLAPCGAELRLYLPDARRCAGIGVAWEDSGGLTRPQALCVVHLAVCLAHWRALETRVDARTAETRETLHRESRQRGTVAARAIWGPPVKATEPRESGPRSLRDLAEVADAFDQWDE